MTIASEITRIQTNIADAYTAASSKGATMPATENSDNLATCIASISGGGDTRFGLSLDNYIGQVDNGTLQPPATFPNSITFTGVETVAQSALSEVFENDNNVYTVSFPDLVTIEEFGLYSAFMNSNIRELYFPALTTAYEDSFNDMLSGCSNVTVHFPFNLESTISSWHTVIDGFGGNNTTILFDLNGCELTFAITPNSGNRLIVNGDELSSNTITVEKGSTASYQIYNSSYGLYISEYTATNADSATVTTDITVPTYNTISLDTGVSGLTVTITVDDTTYTLTESGNTGVYTINLYKTLSGSVNVNYLVKGGGIYANVSGTLAFNNSDISETITMRPAQDVSFTRPNLTENGTMGGDSFAVGTIAQAYQAVDASIGSCAQISKTSGYSTFVFYNPDALKISQLDINFNSSSYAATSVIIEGSDDYSSWTQINTWSGEAASTVTFTVNSSSYYKYHRLKMSGSRSSYVRLYDLGITAVYKG